MIFSNFAILSPLPEGVSARTFCTSEKVDSDADAKSVKAFEKSSIASFVSLMRVAVFAKPEIFVGKELIIFLLKDTRGD
jgi:hypothetical protein